MQFKKQQREAAAEHWGPSSWFYKQLGEPAREIVERAYGIKEGSKKELAQAQEYLTLALSLFARKIGADKSHVVHALLTGQLSSLMAALGRKPGVSFSEQSLAEDWEAAFREVTLVP